MNHNTGKAKTSGVCPFCGKVNTLSMTAMASEILKAIKYPKEKSIYSAAAFNRFEMAALYDFVMKKV